MLLYVDGCELRRVNVVIWLRIWRFADDDDEDAVEE